MWAIIFLLFFSNLFAERPSFQPIQFSDEEITQSKKIEHLIIIFQENWSFDSLYGMFPGVDGIKNASSENTLQINPSGEPYSPLLTSVNSKTGAPYPSIPKDLPNAPYDLAPFIPIHTKTGDAIHRFYQEQLQINDGLMNQFALWSNAGGFVMSYYDIQNTRMGKIAREYTICDRCFHSCYGGSMCSVIWLFAAQMPTWPNAPKEIVARVFPSGYLRNDGIVSPDGYVVNDAEPYYPPHKPNIPDNRRVPAQTFLTIGDLLSEKGISWKWYAQGWNDAVKGKADRTFAFHHQAPTYFKQFGPNTEGRKKHLADLDQFYTDLKKGTLPAVSFIRSLDRYSEHPSNGPLIDGLNWCADLIEKIQKSSAWDSCAIIVTYDENGGRWDHVAPPVVDQFGLGTRVPCVVISPFAKKGYVDHTDYETVSILKFIEERWELRALSERDANANNILNAFEFRNHLELK